MNNTTVERYFIWPMTKLPDGTWSLSDDMLRAVWHQLALDGYADAVFYDGSVRTADEFVGYMKLPGNAPVFVMDNENRRAVFAAWLNGITSNSAYGHFFGIGRGNYRPEMAQMVVEYWEKMGLFSVLLGVLPAMNLRAIRVALDAGFIILGVVPGLCPKADGSVEEGTVLYRPMRKGGRGNG